MPLDETCRAVLRLLLPVVLTCAAGCVTEDDQAAAQTRTEAITDGSLDPGDPAVVRIEGGLSPCTGTLIAARVVLTAAHCVELPPTAVFFGADSMSVGDRINVIAEQAHPAFDAIQIDNDVALVLLERPSAVEPEPVARMGAAPMGAWVGMEVRLVGFGLTAAGAAHDGKKRTGTALVTAAGDTDLRCAPDPSLPCRGDSGGPVLAGSRVIGVVSSGDSACADHARAMRVDAYADSFIEPQIAAWEAMSRAGGGCAAAGRPPEPQWGILAIVIGCIVAAPRRGRARARHSPNPAGAGWSPS